MAGRIYMCIAALTFIVLMMMEVFGPDHKECGIVIDKYKSTETSRVNHHNYSYNYLNIAVRYDKGVIITESVGENTYYNVDLNSRVCFIKEGFVDKKKNELRGTISCILMLVSALSFILGFFKSVPYL